jgi:hypothetical protein
LFAGLVFSRIYHLLVVFLEGDSIEIPSNFQFSEIGRKGKLIRFASSVLTFRELCNASYGNKKESVQS